jgi:hypothetical protein
MRDENWKYIFFYQFQKNDNTEIFYSSKQCKRPRATKDYKNLQNLFNLGLIEVYGYKVESNI